MGLLDDFSGFVKTPEGMGLLSAVAGGLAGAGRGTPWNNLGRAGLAGVMGYGNAVDRQERTAENEQQRKMRQMQMDELTRKIGEQEKADAFYTNVAPGLMSQKPEYAALSNGQGPTVENAASIPQMPQGGMIDPSVLYRAMLNSGVPSISNAGLQGLTKQDEPIKLGADESLVTKHGKTITTNYSSKPVNGYMVRGADGKYVVDPSLFALEKELKATGAPKVSVPVNVSTEKKYGEQFAGKVAEADSAMMDAAQRAPDLAARSNRIKQVLDSGKVITGFGADYRLAFGKAMGVVGVTDQETIANTEALSADLARNTLDAIKASGLGSGNGFSNADRDFLNKAAGGLLTFDSATISRLADLSYRTAVASANRWNQRVRMIPNSALDGTGISREPVAVPELYTGKESSLGAGGWSAKRK